MDELWQLYDEQGRALAGKGATKAEVFSKGLLHGAAHVWVWRQKHGRVEILVQKRAAGKRTWPNRYDISAAGHIDLGEDPLEAAEREAKEEINLTVKESRLRLAGLHRAYLTDGDSIENEFQWLYTLEVSPDTDFDLQAEEVDSLIWVSMGQFKAYCASDLYVPHGELYYNTIIASIEPL